MLHMACAKWALTQMTFPPRWGHGSKPIEYIYNLPQKRKKKITYCMWSRNCLFYQCWQRCLKLFRYDGTLFTSEYYMNYLTMGKVFIWWFKEKWYFFYFAWQLGLFSYACEDVCDIIRYQHCALWNVFIFRPEIV